MADDSLPLEVPEDAEDVQVENAPVRRRRLAGLTIEGYSRAAMQSYWRIPELKLGFDFGLQPWAFMTTPTWAVSHTHMDHIAALPIYVARRRLMKMPEPTIYLPEGSVEDVRALLRAFQRLDRGRLPCNLVGCHPGMEIELSRELVLTTLETEHTVPSLGYIVWDRRKKLKPEYQHLAGEQIRDLRLAGTEVAKEIRTPLVCYLGDTNPAGLDRNPDAYRAKVLILEMTFVAPGIGGSTSTSSATFTSTTSPNART
ncbi:MAG TPA: metal-dependent hydrolase, partial [Planctomycetia bacterium]|nr:metal-dependent hydrolase [Planctomycetia bacterium]